MSGLFIITMTSITVHHNLLGFETSHEVLDLPSRYYDDNDDIDDIDDDDQQRQKIPASHDCRTIWHQDNKADTSAPR